MDFRVGLGVIAAVFLATSALADTAVGPADVWRYAILGNGEAIASNNTDGKVITAGCVGAASGGHEVLYEVPMSRMGEEFIKRNPGEVDVLMWVDGHGGVENDRFKTVRAAVTFGAGKFSMTVAGSDAGDLASSISASDWVTVAVSMDHAADPSKLLGITSYRTSGAAETALRDVLAQCAG